MYDRILFPTDGSDPAETALDYALQVASEHEATLHALNVADTGRDSIGEDVVDALEAAGTEIVDEVAQRATAEGIDVVTEVRRGDPSASIVGYAARSGTDLVVMATHGRRGLRRFLLGSVTERVINTAEVPVISVPPESERAPAYPSRSLLVPTDGSPGAALALAEGIEVANATGATLHVLHVVETAQLGLDTDTVRKEGALADSADEIVAEAVETASASLDDVESRVDHGIPAREIRGYIDSRDIDLVVMGTQGRTDFGRYAMGGVSSKLVRTTPVPVMWLRDSEPRE